MCYLVHLSALVFEFCIFEFWISFWVSEFLNFKFQFSLNRIWFGAWEQIKLTDWTAFSMMSLNPKIFEVFLLDIAMINQNIRYFNFHFNYKKFCKTFYFPSQHCWSAVSDIFYQVLFWIFQKHFQKLLNNLKHTLISWKIFNSSCDCVAIKTHIFKRILFFWAYFVFQLFLCTLW